MKRTRRIYDREFKISAVAELESGKPVAHIAGKHGIIQACVNGPCTLTDQGDL